MGTDLVAMSCWRLGRRYVDGGKVAEGRRKRRGRCSPAPEAVPARQREAARGEGGRQQLEGGGGVRVWVLVYIGDKEEIWGVGCQFNGKKIRVILDPKQLFDV